MTLHNVTITVEFPLDNTLGSMPCAIATGTEYDPATLYGFDSAIQTAPNACTFMDAPLSGVGPGKIFELDLVGFCTSQPCSTTMPFNSRGTLTFGLTTTAPEPGTILLLGMGLAAVMVWRKRVNSITQSA